MNPFEMVVAIIFIVTVGSVIRARYGGGDDRRGAAGTPPDEATDAENQRLRAELSSLKERLAVLERLATDNNSSSAALDREIEKLRDRH